MDTGNISVYRGKDPDWLYEQFPDSSMTFFYVPRSGKLYIEPYPANHQDMLTEKDDLFRDVYTTFLSKTALTGRVRRELSSRGQAIAHGETLIGRLAIDRTTVLIAFWTTPNAPTDQSNIGAFLNALYKKFSRFKAFQANTVLLLPNQPPITVAEYTGGGGESPERAVALKERKPRAPKKPSVQKFLIGGQEYTLSDLHALRVADHSKGQAGPGLGDPKAVLCHPDIDKYPELSGYKPSSCGQGGNDLRATHPQRWRQAGWQAGIPYVYTPEHNITFRSWFAIREALRL